MPTSELRREMFGDVSCRYHSSVNLKRGDIYGTRHDGAGDHKVLSSYFNGLVWLV